MTLDPLSLTQFLSAIHPYDAMEPAALQTLIDAFTVKTFAAGEEIYGLNTPLEGLFVVYRGDVEIRDEHDVPISLLGPRNSFGERGLLRDGVSLTSGRAVTDATLLLLPAARFHQAMNDDPGFRRFFDRSRTEKPNTANLATTRVEMLMATNPLTCPPATDVQSAARLMRDARVSSICVADQDSLQGIATIRDLSGKVVGDGLPFDTPVTTVMTPNPVTLPPSAIGSDVLHMMMERRIGHIPVCQAGKLVGIVTQTDLTRFQAVSSAELVSEIAHSNCADEMAVVTRRIPQLLSLIHI